MNRTISLKIDDEEIVFADLTNRENLEVVAVCKSGNIFLFDLESGEKIFLGILSFESVPILLNDFNPLEILEDLSPSGLNNLINEIPPETEPVEKIIEKNPQILDGLSLKFNLYSFQNYICLVQERGTNGTVLDLSKSNYRKQLKRGDYQVAHCTFPIAFYSKNNQTFLIHGTDWNRLDITCLETDELLTSRIVDCDTDSNYFDYFHSSLLISPNAKRFTTNGWHWHPFGQIYCFSIDDFLHKFEFSHQAVNVSDDFFYDLDWDRPLCWIDNKTLAIGFNQQICDEEQRGFPTEVLLFDIDENKIVSRITFNGFSLSSEGEVSGEFFYDAQKQQLIGLNKKSGVLITDINGNEVYKNSSLISHKYSPQHKLIYQIDNKNQEIELFKLKVI